MLTSTRSRGVVVTAGVVALLLVGAACQSDGGSRTAGEAQSSTDAADRDPKGSEAERDAEVATNPCGPNPEPGGLGVEGEPAREGATMVEVIGVDYAFRGVTETYPAGNYGFTLTNEGEEFHELALMRVKDGEQRSLEEIAQLPPEEQERLAEYVGGVAACPGDTTEALGADLTEGRYLFVCFVPTGMRPGVPDEDVASVLDNPPHFHEGMAVEFRVEAS